VVVVVMVLPVVLLLLLWLQLHRLPAALLLQVGMAASRAGSAIVATLKWH
jgi:hypothetical protein